MAWHTPPSVSVREARCGLCAAPWPLTIASTERAPHLGKGTEEKNRPEAGLGCDKEHDAATAAWRLCVGSNKEHN